MAKMATGWDNTVQLLIDALGLRGRPIQRVVIDIACCDVVKVYVKELLPVEKLETLAECFQLIQLKAGEDLLVGGNCNVQIVSSGNGDK